MKQLTINSMQALVYAARKKQFADSEGLIRSFPLNRCPGSDTRPFLQFFGEVPIEGEFERYVGWAHPEMILQLRQKNLHLFIDSTYYCVPKGFYQCLVLMFYSEIYDMYLPAFYVLMTGKKENLYTHVLSQIVGACNWGLYERSITCDYEQALLNAINTTWTKPEIIGCLFHWKQALRRKLIDLEISKDLVKELMDSDGLINILTVVSPEEIPTKTIPYIREKFPEEGYKSSFDKFWAYFLKTWMTTYDVKVNGKIFKCPVYYYIYCIEEYCMFFLKTNSSLYFCLICSYI